MFMNMEEAVAWVSRFPLQKLQLQNFLFFVCRLQEECAQGFVAACPSLSDAAWQIEDCQLIYRVV